MWRSPINSPEPEDGSEATEDAVSRVSLTKVAGGTALVGSALCVGTAVVLWPNESLSAALDGLPESNEVLEFESWSEESLAGANCHPFLPKGVVMSPRGDTPLKGEFESSSDWRRFVIPTGPS